jgi:probable F420-dependent oxidoreductase
MRLGATTFVTDLSMDPHELGQELEARSYDSLFIAEHTHIPVGETGAGLAEMYRRPYDPMVALTAAVSGTENLVVGTAICLVAQHDPIILAKQIASIDHLSNGRFVLGAGFGWLREEMENHGIDPEDRWTLVREKIGAMRAIWRDEEAEYSGNLVSFDPIWSWPKPSSPSGPPVFIGGAGGARMVRHVVDYADGWLPNRTGAEVDPVLDTLRNEAERVGRDPASIRLIVPGRPEPDFLDLQRSRGCERVLLPLPSAPRDQVLPLLDTYADLAQDMNSAV